VSQFAPRFGLAAQPGDFAGTSTRTAVARSSQGPSPVTEQPHNNLVRLVLGKPEHAIAFLRAVLPPAAQQYLDLDSALDAGEHFVDCDLVGRETDILYAVGLRGSQTGAQALVYVLIEHQSEVDATMAFRLFRYMADIWLRHGKEGEGSSRLPLVIPIVLCHGERPWSAPRDIRELIDAPAELLASLSPYVPSLSYMLEDLTAHSDQDILRMASDGILQLMMLVLRHGRSAEAIMPKLQSWIELMRKVRGKPGGLQSLGVMLFYVSAVRDDVAREDLKGLMAQLGPEAEEVVMTLAERLRAEGRAEGEAKGRVEGEAKGRAATLRKQLTLKFGPLPNADGERLERASEAEIEQWTERVLTAGSLEELFRA